jgi:uncharacterized Zn-binding protein involved in type VI secretion
MINNITMSKAALNGISVAGGPAVASASKTTIESLPPVRKGDVVTGHGDSPHSNPTVAEASSKVKIEGKFVSRVGDAASCNHALEGGASRTNIG